jgi:hypothetical protein
MNDTLESLEERLGRLTPRKLPDATKGRVRKALADLAHEPAPVPPPSWVPVQVLAMAASALIMVGGYLVLSGMTSSARNGLIARRESTPLSMLASNTSLDIALYPSLNNLVNNKIVAVITAPPFVTNGMAQLL